MIVVRRASEPRLATGTSWGQWSQASKLGSGHDVWS